MRGVSEKLKNRSRRLRQNMTPSETRLWAALRDRRYVNLKFRRQQPVGPFIADFCCWEKKVVIELDGDSHAGKEEYDTARQKWLENAGWTVLRIWDSEVYGNINGVMQAIYTACEASRRCCPLPPGEGRDEAQAKSGVRERR